MQNLTRREFLGKLRTGLAALALGYALPACARETSSNKAINYAQLETDLKRHEGVRYQTYLDTTGNRTIGVGFNLERGDARSRLEALGLNYQSVYNGSQTITEEQVNQLLQRDLAQAVKDAREYLGLKEFDELEGEAKEVLVNMSFNLGASRLSGFKKLKSALQKKDYKTAAQEMKSSTWYNQVGNRGKELVKRMSKIAN